MSTTGVWSLRQVNKNILDCNWTYYDAPFVDSSIYAVGACPKFYAIDLCEVNYYSVSPVQVPGTNWCAAAYIPTTFLALKTNNTLWSWGYGWNSGNLNLIYDLVTSPTQVQGTNWCAVSTGSNHITALKTNNTLWAWGNDANKYGTLGLNSTLILCYSSPVQIPGTNWICTENKYFSSYGIKSDNTLWTWGRNQAGQLGLADTLYRSSPTQIGGTNWCKVSGSWDDAAYGIKTNNTLWSWGNFSFGLLGFAGGTAANRSSPVQVGGTNWCDIKAGNNNILARKTDGTLWSWGIGGDGQLGVNSVVTRSSPIQINGTNWNSISAGTCNSMATKTDGTLWSWGAYCFLGFPEATYWNSSPVQIPGTNWSSPIDSVVISASVQPVQYGALKTDGTLYLFGSNYWYNGLGQGFSGAYSPTILSTGANRTVFCKYAGTGCFNIGLKSDKTMWSWGYNRFGYLGVNDTIDRIGPSNLSPVQVGGTNWCDVAGTYQILATKTDNTLWSWGTPVSGLNIAPSPRSSPTQIAGTNWTKPASGFRHNAAFKLDNTLWIWGCNQCGNLGLGDTINRSSPVQLPGTNWSNLQGATAIVSAFKNDGSIWVWGCNAFGSLGTNDIAPRSSPIQIPGTNWVEIYTNERDGTFARKTDGTLWVWGRNDDGMLGINSTIHRSSPVQVPGTNWVSVKGLDQATVGLKTDNTLWTWGANWGGQLGQGDFEYRSSPVQIPGTGWYNIQPNSEYFYVSKFD